MNRTDFINLMKGNVPVSRQMVGEVTELIDIFPYFQSAHMLLLKGLQDNEDLKFENQLRSSSLYIADREVLYNYLSSAPSAAKEVTSNSEETTSQDTGISDNQQTVIESAKNSEQLISVFEADDTVVKQSDHFSADSHSHTILVSGSIIEEDGGVIVVLDEEDEDKEEKIFYMDPGISVPEISDLLELDLDNTDDLVSDEEEGKTDVLEINIIPPAKQLQSELIDRFIIANPRIEPNRDKTAVAAEDISKPFVENEGGFFTETLARIYVNQGYYSKAIDIYEKLSLKFPEKSSYFASQIEKVKEYIKK
jgi:hypothetical protein